jgi:hypothetical protein
MTKAWGIAVPLLALVALGGCGSAPQSAAPKAASSSASTRLCLSDATAHSRVDLLGDGHVSVVDFSPSGGVGCPATVMGENGSATVDDLPLAPNGLRAVTIPGRKGQLVLLVQTHPRGGSQAHLFGYADDKFEELEAQGGPVFPFVATDTGSSHLAAHCQDGGFDVESAQHSSKRTWTVTRTVYQVSGNTVTAGATTEVAQGLSDLAFQRSYADLAGDHLFADC